MAWVTPKVNWTSADGMTTTDSNRIEGNTSYLKTVHDALDASYTAHAADSTKHKTSAVIRAESTTPLVIECRTSDPSSPANGTIWLRTDL